MFIKEYIQECIHLNEKLLAGENILLTVEAIANVIIQAYSDNKKLLIHSLYRIFLKGGR